MPLTDDQRAMLQLLLQRGQSYDDIASLLGLGVDEVRSRARAALGEIGGEDPDRDVSLTDYLLGQADPIGRADAARQLQSDSDARDLAERLATQLRVLAPGAELPQLPGSDSAPSRRPESPARSAEQPSRHTTAEPARRPLKGFASDLSRRQRQAIAGLAGGGIVLLLVVLAVTGVFGGGDGDEDTSAAADQGSGQNAGNASGLTRAILSPRNGSGAEGVAVFARVRQQPILQVNVTGLEPSGSGEAYVIWLYGGPSRAFPLVRQEVRDNGQLRGAAPVPAQLIQALQQGLFDSIDISRAGDRQISAALRQARRSQQLPRYAGQSVARGPITGPGFPAAEGGSGSAG
ncbi:MAG: hypothetical protein ACRDKV_07220 [Solirubrobacterales bacterium]